MGLGGLLGWPGVGFLPFQFPPQASTLLSAGDPNLFFFSSPLLSCGEIKKKKMSDWGPVFVAVILFVLLSPGLLVQIPGKNRLVEFGTMHTSGQSIFVHSIIYFGLIAIFLLAIGVHMYIG